MSKKVTYHEVYDDEQSEAPLAVFVRKEWALTWRDQYCATGILKQRQDEFDNLSASEAQKLTMLAAP